MSFLPARLACPDAIPIPRYQAVFEFPHTNHKDNAAKYDKDEVKQIKDRIMKAAKKQDVEIDPETVD